MNFNKSLINFRDLSKKYQLIFTITGLLLIISLALCILLPKFVEERLVNDFKRNYTTMTSLVANNLVPAINFRSSDVISDDEIQKAAQSLLELDNLTHLYVSDSLGYRLFKKIKEQNNIQVQLFYPNREDDNYLDSIYGLYVVNKNIENGAERLGTVTAIFSIEEIGETISDLRINIVLVCLILLVLEVWITVFISRLISEPLEILLKTFNKIARGHLNERAEIDTKEEFGQIARAFNKMVENLEESYYELSETSRNMEQKVDLRTHQLQEQIETRVKAEEQLKLTNTMVLSIVNTSPLPILTLSIDFKVRSASPAVKHTFLYEEYEIVDKVIPIIYTHEIEFFSHSLKELTLPNQVEKFIIKGRKKNGTLLDLSVAATAEFDGGDNVTGYIVVIDDITERLVAEKALRDSESKYRSLIEGSVIGIALLRDTSFTFANQSLLNIWGYTNANEFLSTPFTEMVVNEDKEKLLQMFSLRDNAYEDEVTFPIMDIRIITYAGNEKNVEISTNLLRIDDYPYLQITFIDITDRKLAEKQMQEMNSELEERVVDRTSQLNKTLVDLRHEMNNRAKLSKELEFKSEILERTTSVVLVWDNKGDCIFMSQWSTTIFEYDAEQLYGSRIWNMIKPKQHEGVFMTRSDIQMVLSGKKELPTDYFTAEVTTRTNITKYLKLKYSYGQNNTLITAGSEITEQILSRRELELMSSKLAKSLEAEKELNDMKTRFISMVSHEFRTPLTVIMSCSSIITQAIETNKAAIANQYVDKIIKSVKTMNGLMEDVLTLGKVQSTIIEELEPIDFVGFIKQSLEDIVDAYNYASKADVIVKHEIANFYSNEAVLKHIVHNLITNAFKYTTNGKPITITIDEVDNQLVFEVKDQGIGIPPDDMKRLFSNFFRAKNVGKIAGTGLGLHIVKQSVDNLHGVIDVMSEVGVGTTFTVILPKDIRDIIASQRLQSEYEMSPHAEL
ncbi:MAG: PAS domain S-box protein [Ignavibacteria bacterium]|jgi:PAS domain S-box-containing protein|nr:PAS domain S-box protein [Ignavibacteria bacterium]